MSVGRVVLDNRRTPCAIGLIRAARRMEELPVGTVMEIWTRDRFAPMEITLWAERDGHEVRDLGRRGPPLRRHMVFEVRRVAAMPPAAVDDVRQTA